MPPATTIVSWSGGKDSCLACHYARRAGYPAIRLLNFTDAASGRDCFHGLPPELIRLQARRLGLPLSQHPMPADQPGYESEFKRAVAACPGARHVVFGDIYLEEHKQWAERVCRAIPVQPVHPLWNQDPAALLAEFITLGFRAIVVSCQAERLGREFVGRPYDRDLLRELQQCGLCPAGEHGEYHTLVIDGPLFSQPIQILESTPVQREGFWKSWQLDIKRYA